MIKRILIPPALLALSTILWEANTAEACSRGCGEGSFIPSGGDVPASLPALRWESDISDQHLPRNAARVEMFRAAKDGLLPVAIDIERDKAWPYHYIIKPQGPLQAGAEYILRGNNNGCLAVPVPPTEARLRTVDPLPLPTSLGELTMGTPSIKDIRVSTNSGSCTAKITAAVAKITLDLSAEAVPWKPALIKTIFVDGDEWSPWPPRDFVFTQCATDDDGAEKGLAVGRHRVKIRATVPGTDLQLETPSVPLWLSCASVSPPPPAFGGCAACAVADSPSRPAEGTMATLMAAVVAAMSAIRRSAAIRSHREELGADRPCRRHEHGR